jgi:hypothetical protein
MLVRPPLPRENSVVQALPLPEAGAKMPPDNRPGGIFLLTVRPPTASIIGAGRIAQLGEHRPYNMLLRTPGAALNQRFLGFSTFWDFHAQLT